MKPEELICALVAVWWVGNTRAEVNPGLDTSLAKGLLRATDYAMKAYEIARQRIAPKE